MQHAHQESYSTFHSKTLQDIYMSLSVTSDMQQRLRVAPEIFQWVSVNETFVIYSVIVHLLSQIFPTMFKPGEVLEFTQVNGAFYLVNCCSQPHFWERFRVRKEAGGWDKTSSEYLCLFTLVTWLFTHPKQLAKKRHMRGYISNACCSQVDKQEWGKSTLWSNKFEINLWALLPSGNGFR